MQWLRNSLPPAVTVLALLLIAGSVAAGSINSRSDDHEKVSGILTYGAEQQEQESEIRVPPPIKIALLEAASAAEQQPEAAAKQTVPDQEHWSLAICTGTDRTARCGFRLFCIRVPARACNLPTGENC